MTDVESSRETAQRGTNAGKCCDFMSIGESRPGRKLAMDIWNSETPVNAEPLGRRR